MPGLAAHPRPSMGLVVVVCSASGEARHTTPPHASPGRIDLAGACERTGGSVVKARFEFRIGNRRVFRSQWEQHLREQVATAAADGIRDRLNSTRCPVHGTRPTRITQTGTVGSQLNWRIEGCCDTLIEAVQQALQ